MKRVVGILLMAISLASCSMSGGSLTAREKQADLGNYRTFAWLPKDSSRMQNVLYDNQIIERNIIQSVNNELLQKGYTVNTDTPDVLIQYTILVEKKEETVNTTIVQTPSAGPNTYYGYNQGATDNPANLYYYSNPQNYLNSDYYINNYPYNTPYGFPAVTGPYVIGTRTQQIEYKEGTLIIDVIDRRTNQLVWRGWNTDPLPDPNTYEQRLPGEIRSILLKFPNKGR